MSKALQKVAPVNLESAQITAEWIDTGDLLRDIQQTLRSFRAGAMDCETARLQIRTYQAVASILALQLEHAKITERINRGDDHLPIFKFIYENRSGNE